MLLLPFLASCSCFTDLKSQPEPISVTVTDVITQIKAELRAYSAYEHEADQKGGKPKINPACKGQLNFSIQSVEVSLNIVTDLAASAGVGATIPIGQAVVGPSATLSREGKGTETITFTIYPVQPGQIADTTFALFPDRFDLSPENKKAWGLTTPKAHAEALVEESPFEGTPIAAALKQVRESLLSASNATPCLTFDPPNKKDQANNITIGFTVTKSKLGKFQFSIFSIGPSVQSQSQTSIGHTIKVTFKGSGKATK